MIVSYHELRKIAPFKAREVVNMSIPRAMYKSNTFETIPLGAGLPIQIRCYKTIIGSMLPDYFSGCRDSFWSPYASNLPSMVTKD
jgi:hypothetical protein